MISGKTIRPGATLGVLGGGQLGRMFAMAAEQMGYRVAAYTPERDSAVSQVCSHTVCAAFEDTGQLKSFASAVDLVTIEFENIPVAALQTAAQHTLVRPAATVLAICQNRAREKGFLSERGFPVAKYRSVGARQDLARAEQEVGQPAVLKAAGFGYDGKGQRIVRSSADLLPAWSSLGEQESILEEFVDFEKEISVIGVRSAASEFSAFGPIENVHRNHILDLSLVPAGLDGALADQAVRLTQHIMEELDAVGLLCVEFFVTSSGKLLINELAPRPHNSGHWSLDACSVSQFEQHVRAIAGLPLARPLLRTAACMVNLLGDLWADGEPDWGAALALPDIHLHLYGKGQARPGRKMGHLTACADQVEHALEKALDARARLTAVSSVP